MDCHDRLVDRARALGARDVRVLLRGTRRAHLTGMLDGVQFVLALPLRPKDIPQNFFASLRDLRAIVHRIRKTTTAAYTLTKEGDTS